MACEVAQKLRDQFEQADWAYGYYTNTVVASKREQKKLKDDAFAKRNRLSNEMSDHRQGCAECKANPGYPERVGVREGTLHLLDRGTDGIDVVFTEKGMPNTGTHTVTNRSMVEYFVLVALGVETKHKDLGFLMEGRPLRVQISEEKYRAHFST
jgi:hypothetical protein